jgi:hypothetical protein
MTMKETIISLVSLLTQERQKCLSLEKEITELLETNKQLTEKLTTFKSEITCLRDAMKVDTEATMKEKDEFKRILGVLRGIKHHSKKQDIFTTISYSCNDMSKILT